MADPDREIREAVDKTFPISNAITIEGLAAKNALIAGLCALRRVLQRDQGGVPEGWRATWWKSDIGEIAFYSYRGTYSAWAYDQGAACGVGKFDTLAEAAAAVAAARQQP